MRLFDILLKRNQQKEQEQKQVEEKVLNENFPPIYKRETVKERYPKGLSLRMLQHIDYSKYGAVLKQQQLLPPSYDRRPISVKVIVGKDGQPNVKLVFKSKTSETYRTISIRGYDVSMGVNMDLVWDFMPIMSREWENFCERVVYCADRGISYSRVNDFSL